MTADVEPIGLIAGNGRLPILVAEGIRRAGKSLVVAGIRGQADPELKAMADQFGWVGLVRLGQWVRLLRRHRVKRAVLVGGVTKAEMYTRFRLLRYIPDIRTMKLWYRTLRHDHRDTAILLTLARELASEGIELMSSVEFCQEHLADEGPMTRTPVPAKAVDDVEFGFRIARRSADMDIGQSLAVKEGSIIAIEAIEGTDRMIARAGQLCHTGGWTLVKVARSRQDMRFDVPTVGRDTIRHLLDAGAVALVLEAGKTLILDKPDTLKLADELGIAVLGRKA